MSYLKRPFYHFSIDDVIDSLIEVSDSSDDLFSHYFFQFLDNIHKKYNTNIDLYCFYQKIINNNMRTLNDISEKYKEIFVNNPWLRFGPHALDYDSPPYDQTPQQQIQIYDLIYDEIKRFSGNISKCELLRLHFFTESYELSSYFKTKNVHSLFTTDKPAIAYRLNDDIKSELDLKGIVKFNEIQFIRSHFRIETLVNENFSESKISELIDNCLFNHGFVSFLTHERELINPKIQQTIEFVLDYLNKKNITSI